MSKNQLPKIIHLMVYKGDSMSYDVNGVVKNEKIRLKFEHGTRQWGNFLKFIRQNGYADVKVDKVLHNRDNDYKELTASDKDRKAIEKEVAEDFNLNVETPADPRDKMIAELKARLDAMEGKKEDNDDTTVEGDEERLEDAKKEYEELYGKKPHHAWGVDKIEMLILEKKPNAEL